MSSLLLQEASPPASVSQDPDQIAQAIREAIMEAGIEEPPLHAAQALGQIAFAYVGRFLAWLDSLGLQDLLEGSGIVRLLAVAATVGLAYLCFRLVRRVRLNEAPEGSGASVPNPAKDAAGWFLEALDRQKTGDLRGAATALYQGVLLSLDARGALAFHPSKTAGDYLRELFAGEPPGRRRRAAGEFLSRVQGYCFGRKGASRKGYDELTPLVLEAGCALPGKADPSARARARDAR